jgi:RNA recognition motif-containing protein
MSIRLYVGNLPKESIEREALQEVFAEANAVVSTKVIKDRKTGKCRGFAFVTVSTDEAADEFIEKYNGQSFMDSPLKIEKANPRSKEDEEGGSESPVVAETGAEETNKKPRADKKRSGKKNPPSSTAASTESFQPDPRWADQLAQLKEKLTAAQ